MIWHTRHLSTRILLWFAQNPDEELLTTDIASRFDVTRKAASHACRYLSREGWLVQEHGRHSTEPSTWTAGPRLLEEVRR